MIIAQSQMNDFEGPRRLDGVNRFHELLTWFVHEDRHEELKRIFRPYIKADDLEPGFRETFRAMVAKISRTWEK